MQHNLTGQKWGTGFFEINLDAKEEHSNEKFIPRTITEHIENKKRAFSHVNDVATLLTNAEILLQHNEKSLAVHLLRQGLYLNSHHPQALRKLSLCLSDKSQLKLKTKTLEALVKSDYRFETVAQLAHCFYHQNWDDKALSTYHEALALLSEDSPELFEIYKNLGNIALRDADFEAAEEYYNKAFTQNPRSDVLAVNKGTLALQRNEHTEALHRFREALEMNHRNDKAWVGLAMAHNLMGDFVLARANVGKALDLNLENRTAVHLAVAWAVRDQDLSFAIEALENYVSQIECDEEMSLLLVHLFCQRNQWTEALLEVERILLWNPKNGKVQKIEKEIYEARSA